MTEGRKITKKWLVVAACAGVAIGAAGATAARRAPSCETAEAAGGASEGPSEGPAKPSCCPGAHGAAAAQKCPVHRGAKGMEVDDQKAAERLRLALVDGVFRSWTETGRAPTPAEFARRMNLSQPEADRLLDQMQACGETVGTGILRVPESELIAVAWPLANVPTGITVTVQGGKPAFARCAFDALGVSEMLRTRTVVEAAARDNGARLRVVVDRDEIVTAEPAEIVVVKGESCDDMSFYSSKDAAQAWQRAHGGEGTLLTLAEAVRSGARTFGRYATGL